jgi:hypothetical protein
MGIRVRGVTALACVTGVSMACAACSSSSGPPSDSANRDASTPGTPSADAAADAPSDTDASTATPTNQGDASGEPGAEAGTGGPFQPTAPSGTAAASASGLCPDFHTFVARCADASCTQAYDAVCAGAVAPALSAAYAAAFHHCVMTSSSCSDGSGETSCMVPLLNAATPTPAQRTLADDFCEAFAGVPSVLDNGLWCMGHALPPGSTGRMLSVTLLKLSDAYAAKVYAAGCIQRAVAAYPTDYLNCDSTFENCVAAQYPEDPAACTGDP